MTAEDGVLLLAQCFPNMHKALGLLLDSVVGICNPNTQEVEA